MSGIHDCPVFCRCKSCGQQSFNCSGHCGHIELVSPAYNPLLVKMLSNILNKACFYCFHFRSSKAEVGWYHFFVAQNVVL